MIGTFAHRGFVFFTNYDSAKGRELEQNDRCVVNFWWGPLERQVRIAAGVIAAIGQSDVGVVRQPRVAILSTGDEIVPPGTTLNPADNSWANPALESTARRR